MGQNHIFLRPVVIKIMRICIGLHEVITNVSGRKVERAQLQINKNKNTREQRLAELLVIHDGIFQENYFKTAHNKTDLQIVALASLSCQSENET